MLSSIPKIGKQRALIVDDDPSIRSVLVAFLEAFGFEADSAHDGLDALEKYQKNKFDIVISDLMMPKMDGMELLSELKKFDPDAIFIMITGYPSIENAIEAIKKGAKDFITKPFNSDEIKLKIDRAMLERNLRERLKSSHGIIWALIISIPVWLFLGYLIVKAIT